MQSNSGTRRWLLPCLLTSAMLLASLTHPLRSAAQSSVAGPIQILGASSLMAVACPTSTTCVAVGTDAGNPSVGLVMPITLSGGNAQFGAAVVAPGTAVLNGVACPTSTSCIAVGQADPNIGPGAVVSIALGGALPQLGATQLDPKSFTLFSVACTDPSRCFAAGQDPSLQEGVIAPIVNGALGGDVTDTNSGTAFTGIACMAGGPDCYPVGQLCSGLISSCGSSGLLLQVNTSAAPVLGPQASTPDPLSNVACPAANICVAAGQSLTFTTGISQPFTPQNPPGPLPESGLPNSVLLDAVVCPNATTCMAVGQDGSFSAGAVGPVPSFGSQTASASSVPNTAVLNGVACATASLCVAVGANPNGPASGGNGVIVPVLFSGSATTPGAAIQTFLAAQLESAACPSTTTCFAVGNNAGTGVIATVTNGAIIDVQTVAGTVSLNGIACPGATCYAAGSTASGGAIVSTSTGQPPFNVATLSAPLNGIACLTAAKCYAVGGSGGAGMVATMLNGVLNPTIQTVSGVQILDGIACPWATCYAVGWTGTAGAVVDISGQPALSATPVAGTSILQGIACPGATLCDATGATSGTGLYVPLVNGVPQSPQAAAGSLSLQAIACPNSLLCDAVGQQSVPTDIGIVDSIDTYTRPQTLAGAAPQSGTFVLSGAGCSSAGACLALGSDVSFSFGALVPLAHRQPPPPALGIMSQHSGALMQGQMGSYLLTVGNATNAGSTSGTVTVSDTLPPGVTMIGMTGTGWTCAAPPVCSRADSLAAGASYPPITAEVNVAGDAPTGTNIVSNQVSVTGGGDPAAPHTASDATTINGATTPPAPAALSIQKSHSGPSFNQGQTGAAYTLLVGNTAGAGPTHGNVTVSEAPPPSLTVTSMTGSGWTCSVLPECQRADVLAANASYPAITVLVNVAADAPHGTDAIANAASVSGGGDPAPPHVAKDPTTILGVTPPAAGPRLSIQTSHTGAFAEGQTGAAYTVTVSNAAATAATSGNVSVVETAPPGMTVSAMSGTGWTCPILPTCVRSDSLSPVSSYPELTVSVNVASTALLGNDALTNHASVTGGGDSASPHSSADPTTITGAASLPGAAQLSINASAASGFAQGQTGASYILSVADAPAAGPTAGAVTVTDNPPPGLTITGMAGAGWTCAALPACTRTDSLLAGQTYPPLTVTITVDAHAAVGLVNNAVTVIGGGDPTAPHTVSEPTTITGTNGPAAGPALAIQKAHTGDFRQGQTGATYTITVSNATGAAPTAGAVTVTDTAPAALTITAMSGTGWTCNVLPTCSRTDALAPGGGYPPIMVTVNVAASAPLGTGTVTNHASVSGGGDPGGPHSTSDATSIGP